MYLLSRQVKIIRYLKGKGTFVKGNELAKILGVTDRTIRNDIAAIKDVYGDDIIEAIRTKGYRYNSEIDIHNNLFYDLDITDSGNRIIYILKKLLLSPEPVDIFDLSEELMISERSIETDIQRLKKIFNTLSLENVSIKRFDDNITLKGYCSVSNNLIYDVVKYTNDAFDSSEFQKFFTNINLDYLKGFIIDILNDFKYESRYLSLSRFMLDIALIIESNYIYGESYGKKYKNLVEKYIDKIQGKYMDMSVKLSSMLIDRFGITISKHDTNFIAYILYIKGKMELIEEEIRSANILKDDFYYFCVDILNRLKNEKGIEFIEDDNLTIDFIFHLKIAIKRIELGIKLYNPLAEKLTKEYTYVIDLAVMIADMIYEKYKIKFDFNEISYIGIYLATAIHNVYDKQRNIDRLKILLYVPEGIGNLNLIHHQIENLTDKNRIIIDGTTNINMIIDALLEYDIIITTSNRLNIDNNKIHIINKRFDSVEREKIKNIINYEINIFEQYKFKKMCSIFFDKNIFMYNLNLTDKYEVIDYMCNVLNKNGYVDKNFKNYVIEREKIVSTEIETGVALPHSIKNTALKNGMAIAFLKNPILWNNHKVKIVCMYANSKKHREYSNMFTLSFVDAVSDSKFIDEIKNCKDLDSFTKLFTKHCINNK